MWIVLLVPVLVLAVVSLVAATRRPPQLKGADPGGLRTVVEWRDCQAVAADVAADAHEQLRQLVGALAERSFIFSSAIDRGRDQTPVATVDVRERRYELHARTWRGGRWLLWIDERRISPDDSDDLRQLLTGLYRVLEERKAESVGWHRRERLSDNAPAPSPFYEE
jgi:hypothetical protein